MNTFAFTSQEIDVLNRYAAYHGRTWRSILTGDHMPRACYDAFTGLDAGILQALRNRRDFNGLDTLRAFVPAAVVCEETGPDWGIGHDINPRRRFYAQLGEGRFAFGPTKKAALENLRRECARDATRNPRPFDCY